MRILYLVPDLFGPPSGIARYCRMVCRALTEAGHRVSVVSLHDEAGARKESKAVFPRMKYVACGGSRALFVRRAVRALNSRPDLVLVGHAHFAHLGWLVARLARARLVSFIYGIEVWEPLSRPRRFALNASQFIISISRFTAQRACEVNTIPLSKVHILHNCLDPRFRAKILSAPADPATADADSSTALSLLTVARINLSERYKGHDMVIRALPALLQRFPTLLYHIVGDGNGRAPLEALAQEHGVAHAVRFHGVVSEAELIGHYQSASVFVMPSRFEGFGFVFLEAMTYGKPVIAGNQDASPEVVADGKVGFTVDPLSVDALVQAVTCLLSDHALRAQMGQAAVAHVAQNFGFESFKAQVLALVSGVRNRS